MKQNSNGNEDKNVQEFRKNKPLVNTCIVGVNLNYYVAVMWKRWNGKELINKLKGDASSKLIDVANRVKAEANQQVPHDEGTLQNSITIMANPANKLEVKIGYGGGGMSGYPVIPYAVKWHEQPANFQKGRKHNYLRDPLNSIAPRELRKHIKIAVNDL